MAFGTLIEHKLSVVVLTLVLILLILILILIIHILSLSPNIFLNTPGKGTFTIHREGYVHSVRGSVQIIRGVILYIAAN